MPVRYASLLAVIILALSIGACSSLTGSSEIADLETQNAQLQGTIQMVGTPMLTIAALEQQATQNVVYQAQMTQSAVQLLAVQATLTVLELGGGSAAFQPTSQPQSPVITGDNPPPQQTSPPAAAALTQTSPGSAGTPVAGTQFTQTVTATDRDSQDCAVGVTSTFAPATNTIYVVTRINTLTAGSVIGARWTANGELFFDDVECWIPRQNYTNICAYCSIVPDGATFDTGQWVVELTLDGQLMAQAQFQVGEGSPQPSPQTTPSPDAMSATGQTGTSFKGN
jgi:hypothetical protein